jgi:hypothetical protein
MLLTRRLHTASTSRATTHVHLARPRAVIAPHHHTGKISPGLQPCSAEMPPPDSITIGEKRSPRAAAWQRTLQHIISCLKKLARHDGSGTFPTLKRPVSAAYCIHLRCAFHQSQALLLPIVGNAPNFGCVGPPSIDRY